VHASVTSRQRLFALRYRVWSGRKTWYFIIPDGVNGILVSAGRHNGVIGSDRPPQGMTTELMSTAPTIAVNQESVSVSLEGRFPFGRNWQRFLQYLDENRIAEAEKSLRAMLEVDNLIGKSFLDIGCGSGLFSLAAARLGASRVHSFDYDPQSVRCGRELKHRFLPEAHFWTIEQGSALDPAYLSHLGQFDVVYSWGVLHHTGDMWRALENVRSSVAPKGKLWVALYNDQGHFSRCWTVIKQLYNRTVFLRPPIIVFIGSYFVIRGLVLDVLVLHKSPLKRYEEYRSLRGMSFYTDLVDWVGGYPFEVAKPEAIFDFFRLKGFELIKLKTVGGRNGNNEFVFANLRTHSSNEVRA
jgi:SAM-dependent methyltransferase